MNRKEIFKAMWKVYDQETRGMRDEEKERLLESISQEAVRRMVQEDDYNVGEDEDEEE